MTTKEVFAAAADLLEREGWCQGSYWKKGEPNERCMMGSVKSVLFGDDLWFGDCDRNRQYIDAHEGISNALGGKSVIEWNDAPGRTKDEVVAKLRELAA